MPSLLLPKDIDVFSSFAPKSNISMVVTLTSVEIPQLFVNVPFFVSSTDHTFFIHYIFWEQDPFVLTDACSGAAAKAQLDFLDCHARLVVYTLLSDKQNCSFGTLVDNYLSSKRCNCWTCFGWGGNAGHWFSSGKAKLTSRPKSYKAQNAVAVLL